MNCSKGCSGTAQRDPPWWIEAIALEAADKLSEAETLIRSVLDPQREPSSAQIAQLYEVRCRRLAAMGQSNEARAAAEQAYRYMREYASGASSGAEGLALSQQAENHRKSLDAVLKGGHGYCDRESARDEV